jgi:c-di-GMP-binding flagellar brake protein YcgR
MYRNVPVLTEAGTEVLVRFISDGGVFQFRSFFQEKTFQPIPLWTIGPIVDFRKIQRRAFYRIESHLPAVLSAGDESDNVQNVQPSVFKLSTKDLSAGGARVISKESFALGSDVFLEIELPGKDPVRSLGKVVRLETAAPESGIYWVSIQFTSIEELDRKKIVRFVFQKQLEHR